MPAEEEVVTLWRRAEMRRWQNWVFPVTCCAVIPLFNLIIISHELPQATYADLIAGDILLYLSAIGASIRHSNRWLDRKALIQDLSLLPLEPTAYAPIFYRGMLRIWLIAITGSQVVFVTYLIAFGNPRGTGELLLAIGVSVFSIWFHFESVHLAMMRTLSARLPHIRLSVPVVVLALVGFSAAILVICFFCGVIAVLAFLETVPEMMAAPFLLALAFKRLLALHYRRTLRQALENQGDFVPSDRVRGFE